MWRRLLGRRLLFFGRLLEVVHVRANACTDVSAVSPRSSLCPPPPSTQPASADTRLCRPSRGLVSWAAAQTAVAPEPQTAARCTVKELSSQAREAGAPYCWRTRQTLSRAHRHTTSWWAGKPVWCTGAVILATPRGSRGGGPPPGPPPWPYGGAFMLAATLSATWHARGRFLLLSGRVPGSLPRLLRGSSRCSLLPSQSDICEPAQALWVAFSRRARRGSVHRRPAECTPSVPERSPASCF
jgi:hypothetical protein